MKIEDALIRLRDDLKEWVTNNLNAIGSTSADKIYPVGSIYMSVNNVNPSTLFGGTWEQIKDRFLLSAGDTYQGGTTGGEATHKLTVDELPSHAHRNRYSWANGTRNTLCVSGTPISAVTGKEGYAHVDGDAIDNTAYTGGSQAHNNMPPYLTVYVWKRTA